MGAFEKAIFSILILGTRALHRLGVMLDSVAAEVTQPLRKPFARPSMAFDGSSILLQEQYNHCFISLEWLCFPILGERINN